MSNKRTNSAVDGSTAAGTLVPASNCRPPLCRVMKLSSSELSMRCRLRVASARVKSGWRFKCNEVCPRGARSTRAVWPWAACRARARFTATVVAPLPTLALTTENTLPRGPSFLTLRWAVVRRTKASSRSVVVVGRSMNSRAPARMALTMTCGWLRPPMANTAESGNSWRRSSTARMAVAGLSAGTSTSMTSGVAACTRRMTGSDAATGKLAQVWTVRATLVPSTNTWSTVRCSLSVATMTTESSAITYVFPIPQKSVASVQFPVASEFIGSSSDDRAQGITSRSFFPIELVIVDESVRLLRPGRGFGVRRNPVHGAENHEFLVAFRNTLASEKGTQDRYISQAGNFFPSIGDAIVDQAGDYETLPIPQFEFSLSLACTQGRDGEAGNGVRVGEIQGADFRRNCEVNIAVGHDDGSEIQLDAKLFEGDGDSGESRTWLDDGERELAAGEEAGFLAVYSDKSGLGQNLEQVLGGQRLDHRAQVNVGLEQKHIENVADGLSGRKRSILPLRLADRLGRETTVLAGG